ncbi:MAG: hypothetical protein ACTSO7_03635 [Candidatus Heimdallarchaeota archaeon]
MPEHVTHRELNKQFEKHTEKCDKKFKQQIDYRHALANGISARISELEDHMETKNEKMLDKIEKIFISVTHISEVTKHLRKTYDSL